jgi:tetratricopeptide (TPR) repeat protein
MSGTDRRRDHPTADPVDPGRARSLDDLIGMLRALKVWAGSPSYATIVDRVNAAWTAAGRPAAELTKKSTVVDCFRLGRRRLNNDLVLAVVEALHPDTGYVAQWRQVLSVVGGEIEAVSQVRVQDTLPHELATFTGRVAELERLCRLARDAEREGTAVVISAIEGMAGVGKTQLAVHAAHRLRREERFERVLFVNLRGFDPDPGQPPVDPAAVLDGFLRLLGVPAQQIPHGLDERCRLYRQRLAGSRSLVILDNAAGTEQIRPLLPHTPGCPVLVTSRRQLRNLGSTAHLAVNTFTPEEAREFLARAAPGVPAGEEPEAAARIAESCGYLPLALGLIASHTQNRPDWTLTDHADRLDERRQHRQLDTGVDLALGLSYNDLPSGRQRLLRLLALHPARDFDTYAAAALAGMDLKDARTQVDRLCDDHLLQRSTPDRYAFHDLIRIYATSRAHDEDRPRERRRALTALFDHYLATAAAAMDTLHPAETHRRPRISPPGTPAPRVTDPAAARTWLDTERPTLIAVAAHTAAHGWPTHTIRLSRTLFRYLDGGHYTDALTVHGHAHHAARHSGDPTGQAHALTDLGIAYEAMGRHESAIDHYDRARVLFHQVGDLAGEARVANNLGIAAVQLGHYRMAIDQLTQALDLFRRTGNRTGEARALSNLGNLKGRLGQHGPAVEDHEQALTINRQAGNRVGEADTLSGLGEVELRAGWYRPAGDHLRGALTLYRQLGNHTGEAWTLDSLGTLHTHLGRPARASRHHQQALAIFRGSGNRAGEAWALNGLGEAAQGAGEAADALTHHEAARIIAADIGDRDQQARAHTGLGHAHHTLGNPALAREQYENALVLYTDLGLPEADRIRTRLSAVLAGTDQR